jgi:hypothetical protein
VAEISTAMHAMSTHDIPDPEHRRLDTGLEHYPALPNSATRTSCTPPLSSRRAQSGHSVLEVLPGNALLRLPNGDATSGDLRKRSAHRGSSADEFEICQASPIRRQLSRARFWNAASGEGVLLGEGLATSP